MPKVNQFPPLPSLTATTKIPVAQRSEVDPPQDYVITPQQLEDYLVQERGFQKTSTSPPASAILVIDEAENFVSEDVEGALAELSAAVRGISSPGGPSAGSVEYLLPEGSQAGPLTPIMYEGPGAKDAITVASSGAGLMIFTIPQSAEGSGATFRIPAEYVGRAGDDAVTIHFQYRADYPFNRSTVTLKRPKSIEVYDRAAESASGPDVLRGGNNPQRRVLPFALAGRMSVQVAGAPEKYQIVIAL